MRDHRLASAFFFVIWFWVSPSYATTPTAIIGESRALLIGINQYQHWPKLNNAINDIDALKQLLINKYGFKENNVVVIKNAEATNSNINEQLVTLNRESQQNDSLLIYFAGHGYLDEFDEAYWVPADAPLNSASSYLSTARLNRILAKLKARHVFLVSDSCYSGGLTENRGAVASTLFDDRYFVENVLRTSRQILTSGGIERVSDDGRDGHSVFAYHLLRELELNSKPYITASELSARIEQLVSRSAQQEPRWQRVGNSFDENGEYIFINYRFQNKEKSPILEWLLQHDSGSNANRESKKPPGRVLDGIIEASLNKKIFINGDDVTIRLKTRRDALVVLFNKSSDGHYRVISSKTDDVSTIYASNTEHNYPNSSSNNRLNVVTFPTHDRDQESFVLVGLPAHDENLRTLVNIAFNTRESISEHEFDRRLSALPSAWIAKAVVDYTVVSSMSAVSE